MMTFKIYSLLFLSFIFFDSGNNPCWGHAGQHAPPASGTPAVGQYGQFSTPTSHAGYGYLDSSEAQARSAFDFSCSDRNMASIVRRLCGDQTGFPTTTSASALIDSLSLAPFQLMAEHSLRRQVYEHQSLQIFSTSAGEAAAIPAPNPECISRDNTKAPPVRTAMLLRQRNSGPSRQLTFADGAPPTADSLATLTPPLSVPEVARVASSADQVSNQSLITGIVTAAYFNRALYCICSRFGPEDRDCAVIRRYNGLLDSSVYPASSTQCRSLNHTLFRIKGTYPGVFEEISDTSTSMSSRAQAALMQMTTLMNEENSPVGLKRMLQGTSDNPRGPSTIIQQIMSRVNTTQGSALRNSLQQLRDDQQTVAAHRASTVCHTSMPDLILNNPMAVRQMLIDAGRRSESERDTLRVALCQYPEFENLRSRHCQVIYPQQSMVDPEDGEEYRVIRGTNMTDYPYSANVNYRMRRYQEHGQWQAKVKLNLHMIKQPGVALTDQTLTAWRQRANDFFNNEARRLGRRINFEINITSGPAADTSGNAININYHQCYCATCEPASSRTTCNNGQPNQADAGNFHVGVDEHTVLHEIGHGLGLSDEYSQDYYNFNSIGEDDSLMVNGTRLYNRHFNRMMEPNECY